MLHNEVKNAIPRQKVCHKDGRIGTVLCNDTIERDVNEPFTEAVLVLVHRTDGHATQQDVWPLEDCEPVPEEPRPFRVGDAVWASGDGQPFFARVEAVSEDGKRIRVNRYNFEATEIRHATPEELARYF